jgi:hypothetical protein
MNLFQSPSPGRGGSKQNMGQGTLRETGTLSHSLQNLFFSLGIGRKPQITVRNGNLAIQPYGNPVTEK